MTSLSNFKKSSSVEKLTKAVAALKTGFKKDETYWELEVDKAGNGYAIIRFLDSPHVDGEDALPFVQYWSHSFQGPGGWYIENSLTTLGKPDPVSEYNGKLWNSGIDANKEIARKQKRSLNYVSNIKVIKDAAHPENEGKVFKFRYGKKIFDKIQEKLNPQFEDEEALNPFNFWEGANFKLKAANKDGYRNYDKSEFEKQTPIAKTDEEIEKIWKSAYSLKEVTAPEKFKTYDQLKSRLDIVLGQGGSSSASSTAETTSLDEDEAGDVIGSDKDMDLFKKLAEE